jgi:predicted RNase H-like nuclease
MLTCIGIDLAWSPRNRSGAAVVRGDAAGGSLIETALLGDVDEIAAYIAHHAQPGSMLVAVDAPLCVPNQSGRRPAEAELGRVFGRYEAGAHPANRRLLGRYCGGAVRGEVLVAALEAMGIAYAPAIAAGAAARTVTEVYPHAAMIGLFGLERTLKYKVGRRRSRATRLEAWRHYQQHMLALYGAEPALHGHAPLLAQDVAPLHGRALKAYEDQVDALLCAYIALYAFRWGAARCHTFGSLEGGSIFTPLPTPSVLLASRR